MIDQTHLNTCNIVRLDVGLFPVSDYEVGLYRQYAITPVELESGVPDTIPATVRDCDALIVVSSALPKNVIEKLSRCRVVSRRGVGTDKIDVTAATKAGILVTNVPGFCANEMAEHTMGLLLSVARKIPWMSQYMASGSWRKARGEALMNRRVAGSLLGLVGFGESAQAVARRAKAFGMKLMATRRRLDEPCPVADELGVQIVDLDTLLREADYVSLHLPLTEKTCHLLDAAKLQRMKPGAVLINTARGAIVDEKALADALREGRLAGAGIDTFEGIDVFSAPEGPSKHPFLGLDNVVLTPHVAAESVEAQQEVARGSIENLVAVLSGHWPQARHTVNSGVIPRVPLATYDESQFGNR